MKRKGKVISDLDLIKKMEVEILDRTVEECEKNGYKYYLAYGTLLGAIRHKGFIPWDDDIDIYMFREDYEKLCKNWDNSGRYKVLECKRDHDYIYPFAKIYDSSTIMEEKDVTNRCEIGIYIDIFPIDHVPAKRKEDSAYIRKCECLEKARMYSMLPLENIYSENNNSSKFLRKILWKILAKIGPAKISRYQDKYSQKYRTQDTEYRGVLCTRYSEREILPKKAYNEEIQVEFEGKKYSAPKEYDNILSVSYGKYMEYPPIEEQVLKHGFSVWEVEED